MVRSAPPTAEWVARQITEAFLWDNIPQYLIRDRDAVYGEVIIKRLRAMGIRDHPTAPRSMAPSLPSPLEFCCRRSRGGAEWLGIRINHKRI